MLFSLVQACTHLNTRKILHLIMVISFILGYAALYVGLSYGDGLLGQVETTRLKEDGFIAELSWTREQQQSGETAPGRSAVDALLAGNAAVRGYTCVTNVYYSELSTGDAAFFHMIDQNFSQFYNTPLLEGRFLTPEELAGGGAVCVAERGFGTLHTGDTVTLGAREYTVVGVVSSALFRGRVLVPQTGFYNAYISGFDVAMEADAAGPPPVNWEKTPFVRPRSQTIGAYTAGMAQYAAANFAAVFAVCLVLFIYMMFNTYNILKNKAVEDAAGFGVRMAMGARPRDIFHQFFFEVLLLMLAALGLLLALEPLLAPLLATTFEHRLGWFTAGALVGSCVLSAFVLAKIVLRKLKKQPIVRVIGEGQV